MLSLKSLGPGSGKNIFKGCFTIYGRGDHLGHMTCTICIMILPLPLPNLGCSARTLSLIGAELFWRRRSLKMVEDGERTADGDGRTRRPILVLYV